jgi:hypothetical protein
MEPFVPKAGCAQARAPAQEISMKRVIILAAAAAIAVTATPALAKSKKKHRMHTAYYGEVYTGPFGYWAGYGAPVYGFGPGNDPSIGHPSAAALSRASGRCVEDLGYGRYKYCGW